jgi:hypothetical protein
MEQRLGGQRQSEDAGLRVASLAQAVEDVAGQLQDAGGKGSGTSVGWVTKGTYFN